MGEQLVHLRNEEYIGQTAINHGGLTTLNPFQKVCLLMVGRRARLRLYGCDELVSLLSEGEPPSPIPDELLIGVVMPQSGAYVDGPDDPNIVRYINGFYMARDEINNAQITPPRIRFILEDNKSTPEGAIAAYNKLIHENGVVALLGPAASTPNRGSLPAGGRKSDRGNRAVIRGAGTQRPWRLCFPRELDREKRIPPGYILHTQHLAIRKSPYWLITSMCFPAAPPPCIPKSSPSSTSRS